MKTDKTFSTKILAVVGMAGVLVLATVDITFADELTWNQTYIEARKLDEQGQWPEALRTAKVALYKANGTFGRDSLNAAKSLILLGDLWGKRGKFVSAEMHYVKGIGLREKILGSSHPSLVLPLTLLGDLYATQGKSELAASAYTRAVGIGEGNDPSSVGALTGLAELSTAAGRNVEAEALLNRSLNLCTLYAKYDGSLNILAVRVLNNLAEVNISRGDYPRAAECYRKALAAFERGNGTDRLMTYSILTRLADVYTKYGSVALSRDCKQRAMALYSKVNGPTAARGSRLFSGL